MPTTQPCMYLGNTVRRAKRLNNLDCVDIQVQSQRNGYEEIPALVVTQTKQVNPHDLRN